MPAEMNQSLATLETRMLWAGRSVVLSDLILLALGKIKAESVGLNKHLQ